MTNSYIADPHQRKLLKKWAPILDYGKKIVANGPRFAGYTICDSSIRVRFTDTAGCLKVIPSGDYAELRYGTTGMDAELVKKAESGTLCGFQIAGTVRDGNTELARFILKR